MTDFYPDYVNGHYALTTWFSGTTSLAPPAGSVGDLLYCVAVAESGSNVTTATPGWTVLQDTAGALGLRASYFCKRREAGEPAINLTTSPSFAVTSARLYSLNVGPIADVITSSVKFAQGATVNAAEFDFTVDPITSAPFDLNLGYIFTIHYVGSLTVDNPPSSGLLSASFDGDKRVTDWGLVGADVPPDPRFAAVSYNSTTNFLAWWSVVSFPMVAISTPHWSFGHIGWRG